ncbi:MAG: molecular chaperone Tir, partial [Nanoarchaeota archaeon]|nr:molecular chaperone Tir [Nanoarchaeota archaeon]
YGDYVWLGGQTYSGNHSFGKRHGQGTLTLPDGTVYVGQFANGKYNGQGTYTWTDGKKYVGQWKDGKQEGQGTFTLPDGTKYVGQFANGFPEGQVTHYMANGIFVGEFKKGLEYKGTFTGKDGTILTGIFSGETKSGTINYPDGHRYEGEWNGDAKILGITEPPPPGTWTYERPHGFGKMTHPDGTVQEGLWEKGQFVGKPITE